MSTNNDHAPARELTVSGSGTVGAASDVATVRVILAYILESACSNLARPAVSCSVTPHIQVSISISVTQPTAQAARETAATSASAVLTAVRQVSVCQPSSGLEIHGMTVEPLRMSQIDSIQPTDVQSTSLTLSPQTKYDPNTNEQSIVGDTVCLLCLSFVPHHVLYATWQQAHQYEHLSAST